MSDAKVGSRESQAQVFQQAILEGKAERKMKAEQRLQHALQRIKEMNSKEEGATKIADAPETEVRGSKTQAHGSCQDLTKSTRIRDVLLPKIVQVDEFRRHLDDDCCHKPLRYLSKSVRTAVDRWMEDDLIKRMRSMGSNDSDRIVHLDVSNQKDRNTLKKMLGSFGGRNPGKRFCIRALSVELGFLDFKDRGTPKIFKDFNENVTTLLKLIGNQIWHFRIFVCMVDGLELNLSGFMLSEFYILLFRWIYLMPNLKWLWFGTWLEADNRNACKALSVFRRHPFPHLPDLERITLNVQPWRVETFPILKGIIAANQHVKALDLEGGDDHFNMQRLPAALIKSLKLTSFSAKNDSCEDMSLMWIQPVVSFNWPLKSILLWLNCEDISMKTMFCFLGHFPTLEKVHLTCDDTWIESSDVLEYVKLPNLTDFEMSLQNPDVHLSITNENIPFLFHLQFLQHCKKLKTLDWKMTFLVDDVGKLRSLLVRHERHEEMVNFRAGMRVLYYSNIWDVFPLLQSVRVYTNLTGEYFSGDCAHRYRRAATGEGMSASQLLEEHDCNCGSECPLGEGVIPGIHMRY